MLRAIGLSQIKSAPHEQVSFPLAGLYCKAGTLISLRRNTDFAIGTMKYDEEFSYYSKVEFMPMKPMVVSVTPMSQQDRVVDLTERRLDQLRQSIADTRTRIESLELIRFRTEIKTGELKRKLARHLHEMKELQARLAELYEVKR